MLSTMSSTTAAEDKAALRRQVRLTLDGLSPDALRRSDDALFAAFSALPQVEAASTIFAFWGIPGREPETGRLVQALTARGKRVGLPRMLPGRQMEVRLYDPDRPLVPAAFGILEPPADAPLLPRADIGLALVPAWALAADTTTVGCPVFPALLWGCAGTVCSKSTSRLRTTTAGWSFFSPRAAASPSETQRERGFPRSLRRSAQDLLSIHSRCHSRSRRSCSRSRSCSHSRFRCRPSCFRSSSTG